MLYPTLMIDRFFENPDEIVKFANKLDYTIEDGKGIYPGKRSQPLHELNYSLFDYINKKVLRLYYPDFEVFKNLNYEAKTHFQLIAYKDVEYHITNSKYPGIGWIHRDPNLITAIIYLTKKNSISGTTIWKRKLEGNDTPIDCDSVKIPYYAGKSVNENNYKDSLNQTIDYYTETCYSKSIYNSYISFDASEFHSANFDMQPGEERLTLISFITKLNSPFTPVTEMRKL